MKNGFNFLSTPVWSSVAIGRLQPATAPFLSKHWRVPHLLLCGEPSLILQRAGGVGSWAQVLHASCAIHPHRHTGETAYWIQQTILCRFTVLTDLPLIYKIVVFIESLVQVHSFDWAAFQECLLYIQYNLTGMFHCTSRRSSVLAK